MAMQDLTVCERRAMMTPRVRAADEALVLCEKCGCLHDENDDCRFKDVAQLQEARLSEM